MIDSPRLLADLTKLLSRCEDDLRTQVAERDDVRERLQADYAAARRVGRTVVTFEAWAEDPITQAAVAWILATVFVRFFEDNGLIDPCLSGVGARHTRALQEHQHYFQQYPTHSERDYLEHVFKAVADLPAAAALFDERHNPLWRVPLSADAARELVGFWQRIDPDAGSVAHDFTDQDLDTRFLGDLYQDLSEPVRKRYALLQTPRFVERFILDRTLTPAIETFGYREVRLIDPACGSGHFLLGAFERLLALAQEHEPGKDVRVLVHDALGRIVGVDINPYAVAIARMRLSVVALRACGIARLADAPAFDINVIVADSLLHGPRFSGDGAIQMSILPDDPANQYYFAEDEAAVKRLLGQRYHAVIANPPYITMKDKALNELYRQRYRSCHRQYSLVSPFIERCFELALSPSAESVSVVAAASSAGRVGVIVANSFMKREFGSKLIESFLPTIDLTHVVDTSGAFIPGHGTPTVILFGCNRRPTGDTRTVMGIRGEPSTPDDPARGVVWSAILDQIDRVDSESAFVSVRDLHQKVLHAHPWSLGGGGAAELRDALSKKGVVRVGELVESMGFIGMTHADEVMVIDPHVPRLRRLAPEMIRAITVGEDVRDWSATSAGVVVFPYDAEGLLVRLDQTLLWYLWPFRSLLGNRATFGGGTYLSEGRAWWEWHQVCPDRLRTPLTIAFAFVATHNHFVLDRGGKVFKQSAPVIKLPAAASEDDHHALLGLLNSSTACFWMKQVLHNKGATSDSGVLQADPERFRFEFDSTKLRDCPVPQLTEAQRAMVVRLSQALTRGGRELTEVSVDRLLGSGAELSAAVRSWSEKRATLRERMVRWQEELDWLVYEVFSLLPLGSPAVSLVWRQSPEEMPPLVDSERNYRVDKRPDGAQALAVYEARRLATELIPAIGLIEVADFKRRWFRSAGAYDADNLTDSHVMERALRNWLLDRLEDPRYWPSAEVTTCARLADEAKRDEEFIRVAEVYRGGADFDVTTLVTELVTAESVPYLPVLRYTDSGLRKRAQWERTWDLQRQEDAGLLKGETIPVPPKYASTDFKRSDWWRLRGKLDVPKERFILYLGAERAADPTPVVAWAGWDHAQQARALGAYYMRLKGDEGSASPKLVPLLAGLLDLVPWLRQWHAGIDPDFGLDLGDYYAGFVDSEARALSMTVNQVRAWTPPAVVRRAGGRSRRPPTAEAKVQVDNLQ